LRLGLLMGLASLGRGKGAEQAGLRCCLDRLPFSLFT
jgi:hypothetical protein